jgi:hypothetical protein
MNLLCPNVKLNMDIANVKIPFTDKKQQINEFIMSECQTKYGHS